MSWIVSPFFRVLTHLSCTIYRNIVIHSNATELISQRFHIIPNLLATIQALCLPTYIFSIRNICRNYQFSSGYSTMWADSRAPRESNLDRRAHFLYRNPRRSNLPATASGLSILIRYKCQNFSYVSAGDPLPVANVKTVDFCILLQARALAVTTCFASRSQKTSSFKDCLSLCQKFDVLVR